MQRALPASAPAVDAVKARRDQALGVTVEASYTVGEYDIVILSGTQSDGLETWLRENGYRIPQRRCQRAASLHPPADEVLRREGEPRGAGADGRVVPAPAAVRVRIRPLHAAGATRHAERARPAGPRRCTCSPQTAASRRPTTGRSSCPSNVDVPVFVRSEFAKTYKAMFQRAGGARGLSRDLHRVFLGHELVRSVRGRSAVAGRVALGAGSTGSATTRCAAAASRSC